MALYPGKNLGTRANPGEMSSNGQGPGRGARATNRSGKRGGGTDDAHAEAGGSTTSTDGAAAQREADSRGDRARRG